MTDAAELKSNLERWRDAYVEMVKSGVDPYEAADAMLTFSGLMLERLRGTPAACTALIAGAEFMQQRASGRTAKEDGTRH